MQFGKKWIALLLALAMLLATVGYAEEAVLFEPIAEEAVETAEEIIEEEPTEAPVEEPEEESIEVPVEEAIEEPIEEFIEEPEEAVEAHESTIIQPDAAELMECLKDIQAPAISFDAPEDLPNMVPIKENHTHNWRLVKEGEIEATYKQLYGNDAYLLHKVTLQQSKKYECVSCHAIKDRIAMMTFEEPHGIINGRCHFCDQIPAYSYSTRHTKHDWSMLLPASIMQQAGFINGTEYTDDGENGHIRITTEFVGFSCSGCDGVSVGATVITDRRYHDFVQLGDTQQCVDCDYTALVPKEITLSAKNLTLGAGESAKLSTEILPEGAQGEVFFTTSDPRIVLVDRVNDSSIMLQAIAKGTATITAKTANGKKAKCKVTVKKAPKKAALSKSIMEMGLGESTKLQIEFSPKNSFGNTEWSSSDDSVVSVDNGELTALSEGSALIAVKVFNLPHMICEVTVKGAPTAGNAKLTPEAASVKVKKKLQLGVVYDGAAGAVKSWRSSNKKVATVNSKGVVKGVKKGTATITATLYNGIEITTVVTVTK